MRAICKGNSGSQDTSPRQKISAHGRSISRQVSPSRLLMMCQMMSEISYILSRSTSGVSPAVGTYSGTCSTNNRWQLPSTGHPPMPADTVPASYCIHACTSTVAACSRTPAAGPESPVPIARSAEDQCFGPCPLQVMGQWYPRDMAGAFHRRTIEGVPQAWFEAVISLIQLTMQEQGMAVDSRLAIRQYMSQ